MYINKEDYDIHYNGELIKDVVDIDVCEVLRLGDKGDWSMPGYPDGDVFRPQRNASPGEGQRREVQI